MLTLTLEDIAVMAIVWLACGAFGAFVFMRYATLKWAGRAVINAFGNPSEEMKEALKNMLTISWNWFVSAQMPTGRKLTTHDAEGVEHTEDEFVPPYIILARSITQNVKMSILGTKGKDAVNDKMMMDAIAADMQDPSNPLGGLMRGALPGALARAQKTGDYRPLLQLVLGQLAQDYLKKKQVQQPQQPQQPNTGSLGF